MRFALKLSICCKTSSGLTAPNFQSFSSNGSTSIINSSKVAYKGEDCIDFQGTFNTNLPKYENFTKNGNPNLIIASGFSLRFSTVASPDQTPNFKDSPSKPST